MRDFNQRQITGDRYADDFWINVGAAFPHQDGKGFNVIVQALPIDGKIVLREPQDEPQENTRGERSSASPSCIAALPDEEQAAILERVCAFDAGGGAKRPRRRRAPRYAKIAFINEDAMKEN